jgi:hypothetical protein
LCGNPATPPGGCGLTIDKPVPLSGNQCIELVGLTVSRNCPVALNSTRTISFRIQASASASGLQWRRSSLTGDAITPSGGSVSASGFTDVSVSQTVQDRYLLVEVVNGSDVLLRFTLANY